MREGHQLQFPSDIEVFYVAPPALDEIKRWSRSQNVVHQPQDVETQDTEPKTKDV